MPGVRYSSNQPLNAPVTAVTITHTVATIEYRGSTSASSARSATISNTTASSPPVQTIAVITCRCMEITLTPCMPTLVFAAWPVEASGNSANTATAIRNSAGTDSPYRTANTANSRYSNAQPATISNASPDPMVRTYVQISPIVSGRPT